MTNLAFHNDIALHTSIIAQVAAHEKADEIVQGIYWENGKGCFIGCIAHGHNIGTVEKLTGFPVILTKIAESIFERLPNEEAMKFPRQILESPRVGADLSLVAWKFLHAIVIEALEKYADDKTREACSAAVDIVLMRSRGENAADARAAAYAADAAYAAANAADAAYAAANAAANAAARAADAAYSADAAVDAAARAADADAADAAYAAAADAADAATYAATDAAARAARAATINQRDLLIKLLKEA